MHVCYALSTNGEPHYGDLLTISAGAVRRLYPDGQITILTDDQSWPRVAGLARDFGAVTRSIGAYAGNARARSRFVKTQARGAVEGDFVFLDADTLPVAAFDELLACPAPVGAALDRRRTDPPGGFPVELIAYFERLGWAPPPAPYLNSGAVFWRDCEAARELCHVWHRNWRKFFETVDNPLDQGAFNHSIASLGITPAIVDAKFNFWPGGPSGEADDTRIYHFFAHGADMAERTILDALLDRLRDTGRVDLALIEDAARRGGVALAGMEERAVETQAATAATVPTTLDQLPALPALAGRYPAEWDSIDGLSVRRTDGATPAGQTPLELTATTAPGKHRLGLRIRGTDRDCKYRISAWLRPRSPVNVCLELRDNTYARYGKASFTLGHDANYGNDPSITALGVSREANGWTRIWAEMEFSGDHVVADLWLADRLGRTEFRGDGRTGVAFGGFDVAQGALSLAERRSDLFRVVRRLGELVFLAARATIRRAGRA